MHNFNTNTDNNDEWLTPPEIVKALGHFDMAIETSGLKGKLIYLN